VSDFQRRVDYLSLHAWPPSLPSAQSLLGDVTLARTYGPGAVLIIEGTWYPGEGVRFDVAKLTGYPSGH
jgi:hypothetical protein